MTVYHSALSQLIERALLRPHAAEASNRCQKPEAGAQFLPTSAAVRRKTGAHGTPGHGQKKTSFWRGSMESRRANTEQRRERAELDPRFGRIGISAVAAALQYRSETKNLAYAPVEPAKQPELED